jgi:hypothetical protein
MKPSDFLNFPHNRIMDCFIHEGIAQNIMNILADWGGIFRELTFKEYVKYYKDKGFSISKGEEPYFDRVKTHCATYQKAQLFSFKWRKT